MDERLLKLAPGLLVALDGGGAARVWHPRLRRQMLIEGELLALLIRFADGKTIAQAAEAAGVESDDALAEAVARLVEAELLVDARAPLPPPPRPPRARERIEQIVDGGSFQSLESGGVLTGFGTVDGRKVAVAAWEPGAEDGIEALLQLQERVAAAPCPLVYLFDWFSIGRAQDQFAGARSMGRIYANQARLSGVAPQLGIVYGSLWRPAALLPPACDAIIMIESQSFVQLGDVDAVKEFTGETVTAEALGGARMHAETSGLAHLVAASSAEAAMLARRYLSFMPTSSGEPSPRAPSPSPPPMDAAALDALVPADGYAPFPILDLAAALVDAGSLLPLREDYAAELATAFARLDGVPIGVVANCSQHKGGILTVEAADKAARFVTLCDAYGLPLLFLVDVPGLAIGRAAERAGIERAAAHLFSALAHAAVPRLTLVVRKAHTAGLYAMCGPPFDPDVFLALPTASIAIFGERLVPLERALDETGRASLRDYLTTMRPPPDGLVDEVVAPSAARAELIVRLQRALANPRPRPRRIIPA